MLLNLTGFPREGWGEVREVDVDRNTTGDEIFIPYTQLNSWIVGQLNSWIVGQLDSWIVEQKMKKEKGGLL